MAKNFPSDFYVTCATVIPVLFLAMIVQGGTYQVMLDKARDAARTLPRRNRDYITAKLLPRVAYAALTAGLLGEVAALTALYSGSDTSVQRFLALSATLLQMAIVAAAPAWKW